MATLKVDEQGLYDILNGSTFLASGGGGSLDSGLELIKLILADKKWTEEGVTCVSPEDIKDGDNLSVVCAPSAPQAVKEYGFGKSPLRSFELMEKMFDNTNPFEANDGKTQNSFKYNYTIPIETGCLAHLMAIQISLKKEIDVLDGDGAGRAYPKMSMNTFAKSQIPIGPMSLVTEKSVNEGGTDILINLKNADNVDEIFRNLLGTDEFHNVSSSTCFTMTGKQIKEDGVVVKGTISKARKLGEILRTSKENVIDKVLEFLNEEYGFAKILIEGKVSEITQNVVGGFDVGIIKVSNQNEEVEILNQNENILAWSNTKTSPIALGPDLICYMDKDGNSYSNPDLEKDKEIIVIAVKADEIYNTSYIRKEFKEIFESLNYFGPYISIEKISE